MSLAPRLKFQDKYISLYETAAKSIFSSSSLPQLLSPSESVFNLTQLSFAVADWRSGDYCRRRTAIATIATDDDRKGKNTDRRLLRSHLERRRRLAARRSNPDLSSSSGGGSSSISCSSAHSFAADVRTHLQNYLKTSNSSSSSNSNLKIFVTGSASNQTDFGKLSSIDGNIVPIGSLLPRLDSTGQPLKAAEILLVETLFMLHAPLFFSYGSHVGSDVVEYERMRSGRPFCTRTELSSSPKQQQTWCQIYKIYLESQKPKRTRRNIFNKANKTDSSSKAIKSSQEGKKKSWKSLWGLLSI